MAVRMLLARKGLAVARIATVAVVVAAVSAVFTVASATFLRPLPFPNADRLMLVYLQPPGTSDFASATVLLPSSYARLRERVQSFEQFEGELGGDRAVAGDTDADSVTAARVSAGYFTLLGGTAILGRTFSVQEVADDARVVVLSHGLWIRRFGGDTSVIGRALLIDREPHTIIGVLSAAFVPAFARSEFWTPLNTRPLEQQAFTNVRTLARLKQDRTIDDARRELQGHFESIRPDAPPAFRSGWAINLVDLRTAVFGARAPVLYMLLAAAAVLALIAIANLANLTLADVMHRRADFAVRVALGGNRAGIAAPEVLQSMLLAVFGGISGLVAAGWLVPTLLALDPSSVFTAAQLSTDWRIALCAFGVAAIVMMLAVAVPVLRAAGAAIAGVAAGSRRSIGSAGATRLRLLLVGVQTALAIVLLSVGAVVVATLLKSGRLNPGFDPRNVMTAQLRLSQNVFPTPEARSAFIQQVLSRVRSTPGVLQAGTTMNPFAGGAGFTTLVHLEGRPTTDGEPRQVQFRRVSPGFFATLGIRLIEGRDFDDHDEAGSQPVAIVSRGLAERFWPQEQVAGKQLKRGAPSAPWSKIVGVVDDVRDISLDQAPIDTVYIPVLQNNNASAPISLVVRTVAEPGTLVPSVKTAVWSIDAKQPLSNIVTMEAFLSNTLGPQRFRAVLVAVCGIVGLLLAIIGTYGVTARSVSERRREVGIRLALGGSQRSVWWSTSAASIKAVMYGAVGGAVASVAAGATLRSILPEVGDGMWIFSLAAGVVLVTIAAGAAMTAARLAAMVDPMVALRAE